MKIMYLRKSRADNPYETVEEVLSRHEATLQECALNWFGEKIPECNIYREVVSGEKIENRPEMQIVLRRMESPEVDGVLVVDPQRLSRGELKDCGTLMEIIKYSRTLVYTPSKIYDLQTRIDERNFRDELLRGRDYLDYTKEIMERGRKLSSSEGWYLGSTPPFGYDFHHVMDGRKRRQTLKPNPAEAEAVQHVYEWFVNLKLSLYQIALKLDALGYKPRRAPNFTADGVRTILSNPVYIGVVAVGRRNKTERLVDGKVVVSRNRQKPTHMFPGRHPAIISSELYYAAQDRLGTLPKITGSKELRNPLAGIVQCSCGYNMVYHPSKKGKPRLECGRKQYCKTRGVNYEDVAGDIIEKLMEIAEDFEIQVESGVDVSAQRYQEELEIMKATIAELDAKQERLFAFLESGTYDEVTFRQRNTKLVEERSQLREAYEAMAASAPPVVNYNSVAGTLYEAIDAMKSETLTPQQKNDFLKEAIDKIVYTALPPIDDGTRWGIPQFKLDVFLRDISL